MKKGYEISSSSTRKSMAGFAYAGPISTVQTTVGHSNYENKSRVSFIDKQTGSYERATATEKAFAGNFQWQNGNSGTMSEYKETSTVRIGNRRGYTEVYNEQRVRDVSFDDNNGSQYVIAYNSGDGGKYDENGVLEKIMLMVMFIICCLILCFIFLMV